MKRMIKASDNDDVRVVSVGLDVVLPEGSDGKKFIAMLEDLVDQYIARKGIGRIAGIELQDDLTDVYKKQYPDEMTIYSHF